MLQSTYSQLAGNVPGGVDLRGWASHQYRTGSAWAWEGACCFAFSHNRALILEALTHHTPGRDRGSGEAARGHDLRRDRDDHGVRGVRAKGAAPCLPPTRFRPSPRQPSPPSPHPHGAVLAITEGSLTSPSVVRYHHRCIPHTLSHILPLSQLPQGQPPLPPPARLGHALGRGQALQVAKRDVEDVPRGPSHCEKIHRAGATGDRAYGRTTHPSTEPWLDPPTQPAHPYTGLIEPPARPPARPRGRLTPPAHPPTRNSGRLNPQPTHPPAHGADLPPNPPPRPPVAGRRRAINTLRALGSDTSGHRSHSGPRQAPGPEADEVTCRGAVGGAMKIHSFLPLKLARCPAGPDPRHKLAR